MAVCPNSVSKSLGALARAVGFEPKDAHSRNVWESFFEYGKPLSASPYGTAMPGAGAVHHINSDIRHLFGGWNVLVHAE